MIDKERIALMIKDIERYLADLSEIRGKTDTKYYYAVSMIVFSAMNRAIDIGNEIIAGTSRIPVPGSYKETFELLSKNHVISAGTEKKMRGLMKYRNIIAHAYYELSSKEIEMLRKEIVDVMSFIEEIKKHLK